MSFSQGIQEKITAITEPHCPYSEEDSIGSIILGSSGLVEFQSDPTGKMGKPFEIKYDCDIVIVEPCEDLKAEKWCKKQEKKGKCSKKNVQKKCKKTCEMCDA